MEPSGSSPGGQSSQTRIGLKGPRPTQLKVSKDSHKIKKPPVAPAAAPPPPHQLQPAVATTENRQPVVIYAVSPKVIHTTVSGFMDLVQRLTGSSSSSSGEPLTAAITTGGDISPAARLASIEKASPSGREKNRETSAVDIFEIAEGVEVGQMPGILSPAPATLPTIWPGLFSPPSDPQNLSLLYDLSPFMQGNNIFIPSPSTLYTAPLVSPSPSSFDLPNPFFDF